MAGHREPRRRDRLGFHQLHWPAIRQMAKSLGGDGCSGPTIPLFVDCCDQHDIAYRTHSDEFGDPITRAEADARMRECIQSRDPLGEASVVAQWRFVALRMFGWLYWRRRTPATTLKRGLYERLAELQTSRVGEADALHTPDVVAETAPQAGAGTVEASGVDPGGQ